MASNIIRRSITNNFVRSLVSSHAIKSSISAGPRPAVLNLKASNLLLKKPQLRFYATENNDEEEEIEVETNTEETEGDTLNDW